MPIRARVKKLRFEMRAPLYGCRVIVFLGYTPQEVAVLGKRYNVLTETLRAIDGMNPATLVGRSVWTEGASDTVVMIHCVPRTAAEHGLLVHELYHAVDHILHAVGVKHKHLRSCEAWAYLMQWAAEESLMHIWTATNVV